MTVNKNRSEFRRTVFERDNHTCIVPWCDKDAVDAHHIIERDLWNDGGYITENGASVCENHHRLAEKNVIPPQSFWLWISLQQSPDADHYLDLQNWNSTEITNPIPEDITTYDINKWGVEFDAPKDIRENIKYQSTRHCLPLYWNEKDSFAKNRMENEDTGIHSVDTFVDIPLVVTEKIDGSNCMLLSGTDTPVRARNGSSPTESMRPLYREGGLYWTHVVNQKLPERLQVFCEWAYAKHSIHYGCDCEDPCEDIGPNLGDLTGVHDDSSYVQIFGVFDTVTNLWLSWPEVETVAEVLGFPTVPVLYKEDNMDDATFTRNREAIDSLLEMAHEVVDNGGEGIVFRSKNPFHYAQFEKYLGKYVRENHVNTDTHWSHTDLTKNNI